MIKKEKWIVDDDELRLFYGDENFNGSAYPCDDPVFMKMIADKLNKLEKENEQLYELINFVNTLIVFECSESCQMKWKKRLEELKNE